MQCARQYDSQSVRQLDIQSHSNMSTIFKRERSNWGRRQDADADEDGDGDAQLPKDILIDGSTYVECV